MSRPLLALFTFAVLSPGCVPVTEPLGDIDKAEAAKDLVGSWETKSDKKVWVVDRPGVKGNPKGLMRVRVPETEQAVWFFAAQVGKHRYLNVLLEQGEKYPGFAPLGKEGQYAAWAKSDRRGYGIFRFEVNGDAATLYQVEDEAFTALMKAEKFTQTGGIFQTSAGWLTKRLEKNDPEKVFKDAIEFTRVKKK